LDQEAFDDDTTRLGTTDYPDINDNATGFAFQDYSTYIFPEYPPFYRRSQYQNLVMHVPENRNSWDGNNYVFENSRIFMWNSNPSIKVIPQVIKRKKKRIKRFGLRSGGGDKTAP
jgi:hypothetical protein